MKASKEFARKAGSGTTRVPVIPTGGQPIPAVTPTGGANPIVGPIPSRLSPSGGVAPQTGSNFLKNLKGLNPFNNPKRLLDPTGFRGGLLYGAAANTVLPRLGFNERDTAAITAAVTMPGGPALKFLAGAITSDLNNPFAKGTLDSIPENLSPEQQALRDKLLKERIAAGTQFENSEQLYKAAVGNSGLINQLPSTPEERAYNQEKSRALQLAEQDQLAKKYRVADLTQQYNSASTPEEKQRIGLQIWATTNPQLAQSVSPRQVGYEQAQAVVKPPKDDKLDQTQKALLKQAFQRQLKK